MKFSRWFHYVWKVPLCGLIFFFGLIPGNLLATAIGLPVPELPVGVNEQILGQYTILASLILALGLVVLARGLSGGFLSRWLILFFITWIAYGVNNYFEAVIFTTTSAASVFSVVLYLPASLLCGAAVARLFPDDQQSPGFFSQAKAFFAGRTIGNWAWRLSAAFLAFPVIYYFFGRLISPIVLPYYLEGAGNLTLPGWNQLLPVLALRSLLFLLACLPILITWRLSYGRLFLALGLALFLLVGGISMMYVYWLAPVLRVTHSLEIFADELFYAGALILLLGRRMKQPAGRHVLVPAR